MLLARKGFTYDHNQRMLVPIEDAPGNFIPADKHGIPELQRDGDGPNPSDATFAETLMYEGNLRDEDYVQSVVDQWARDERFASYNAYSVGSGTESESVWIDGFLMNVVKLIDENVTRHYHAKLLNVYYDKVRGKLATGSVRFTTSPSGKPAFYCVRSVGNNPTCKCQVTYDGFAGDYMDFLWLAYVHGLNHGPKWGTPYGERVLNDPFLTDTEYARETVRSTPVRTDYDEFVHHVECKRKGQERVYCNDEGCRFV